MFLVAQITSNNANIRELEDNKKFSREMEFYEKEARKVLVKQRLISTYRNDDLRVLLKSYQVKTAGTNKTELKDSWKDILDKMDPPPPFKNCTAKDEDALTKMNTYEIPIGDTALGKKCGGKNARRWCCG